MTGRPPPWHIALAIVAVTVAATAIGVLVQFAVNRPLCCADDASFAVVSKNLANGLGYLLTLKYYAPDFSGSFFDPQMGTGPTSIVPVAVAIWMFGADPAVPGLAHIALSVVLLAIVVFFSLRGSKPGSRSVVLILFVLLAAGTSAYHLEQWYAQLGEVLAALLICAGASVWAFGRREVLASVLCGAAFGLAVLSKHLAVLYFIGPALVLAGLVLRQRGDPEALRRTILHLLAFGAAAAAPIAAAELWKAATLGTGGWLQNWKEFLEFLKHQGLASARPATQIELLLERAKTSSERFGIGPWVFVVSAVALMSSLKRMDEASRKFAFVLLAGLLANVAYWVFASNGWPRYVFIAIVVYCFLLSYALVTTRSQLSRIALCTCVAFILVAGLPRLSFQRQLLDDASSPAKSPIRSAKLITAEIQAAAPRGPVYTQWWAHVAALEYLSPTPGRFRGYGGPASSQQPVDLVVTNKSYLNEADQAFAALLARCPTVIASHPPYTLFRCTP